MLLFLGRYWVWIAAILLLIAAFAFGVSVRSTQCQLEKAQAVESALRAQQGVYQRQLQHSQAYAQELENRLLNQGTAIRALQRELKDEIGKYPVYRECKLTAGGVHLINEAIIARGGAGTH